jgi:hypothetical protein
MTIVRRFDVEVGTCASCGRQAEAPAWFADLRFVTRGRGTDMARSLGNGDGAQQRIGSVARVLKPPLRIPPMGTTGAAS